MDFETDPAAEFLNRERETLGDLENEIVNNNVVVDEQLAEHLSSGDDFVMVNDDADLQENNNNNNVVENEELFVGMQMPSSAQVFREEVPEKIKIWRENQTGMLEKKDSDEMNAIEKLREEGKSELDNWYKSNQSSLEKTKANNRMNDSNHSMNGNENGVEETDDTHIWENISELCNFQKISKSGRDTSRMKSIFLQLKQNPLNKNV